MQRCGIPGCPCGHAPPHGLGIIAPDHRTIYSNGYAMPGHTVGGYTMRRPAQTPTMAGRITLTAR